jgi:hypothetical protein
MRLLEVLSNGDFRLTDNFPDNKIPRYAILSHTWGSEEVTFEDIDKTSGQLKHQGRGKAGYEKIEFCGKQSARDGLQYFWVDSCCIDKSIRAELQHALSSMFIWYERAEKCYVYLSDVTLGNTEGLDKMQTTWQQAFQRSKWFTRGWTLQELLAPISVEFFSKDAYRLGNSRSLEQQIHNITAIPVRALRGEPLSQFSVNERLRWKESRITTIEEDLAYSLLGIFGVDMPLEYGEGRVAASKRLRREIDKQETCVRDLRLIDPGDHKQDIEQKRGGLVENSFRWILEHPDFQKWGNDELNPLLWINGDPGKGKTMLLCAIVNELRNSMDKTDRLLYFFCEATNIRINNATAVLRGLMYMLVRQQPSLVSHIQKKYDYAGKTIFEGPYAWVALSNMFSDMLQDPNLRSAYIIIDALDECTVGLPELLDFIIQKTSTSPHIKWLISSRNWPSIENRLDKAEDKVRLSLELNAESVSTAVNIFIRHKVQQLVQDDKLHDAILDYLVSNADNTFLWVALVCQNLEDTPRRLIRERLKSFPPGLDSLYGRMITQIYESKDSELCKRILASIATVYEPITISELSSLVKMPEESSENVESLHEIVNLCGSFLVVRNHRIYLVHQSAKDYLLANASGELFPSGRDETHHAIFSRSLMVMSRMLRRDMYNLKSLGCSIEEIQLPDPDPLATSRYSCIYWADHLCESDSHHHVDRAVSLQDGGSVDVFMKEKYLYWIEALSLCRSVSKGVLMVAKLQKLVQVTNDLIIAPILLT